MKGKEISAFILIVISLLCFYGCRQKGCTDPNAINYNSVADEDDGSCVSCKLVDELTNIAQYTVYDNNFSSPHYGDNVAAFYVEQVTEKYNYSDCGNSSCRLNLYVISTVPEQMTINFTLQGGSSINIFHQAEITIPGNQNTLIGEIPASHMSNPCGFLGTINVQTNNNISYQ